MKKNSPYIKLFLFFIFILIFWYFSIFNQYDNKNVKNVLGIFSFSNNFDSSIVEVNEKGESSIDDVLISITLNSKTLSKLTIKLYDEDDNIINILDYNDCILKKRNSCTYLVEEYNVKSIRINNYNNKNIKINNKSDIKQIKTYISIKLLISLLVTSFIALILKILNKYSFDEKIRQKFKNFNINKIFVLMASATGIITSILIPLYQVPDEQTHINMIYEERNIKAEFQNSISKLTGAENVATNSEKKVKISKYFDLDNRIHIKNNLNFPKITLIRHLPQSVGMIIGELLHLPVFMYSMICELFALAFYIFICNIALKKIPIKKNMMMMIMLLPVAIQQMSSFSYDVVLNSFCFLLIAYILELKYNNEIITNKTVLKLLLILIVIAICKIPYVLLGLLIFILPIKNVKLTFFKNELTYKKVKEKISKHKLISTILISILIIFILLLFIKILLKIDIGRVLIASVINLKNTMVLYKKTLNIYALYYLDTISGNLGWFDTKFPILLQIYIYISLFVVVFYKSKKEELSKSFLKSKDIIIFYAVAILLIYIIILSMFEWTLMCSNVINYNALSVSDYANYFKILPYIGGVQGRYFLPVLPLILLPLNSKKITNFVNKLSPLLYQILYYIILFTFMIVILLYRYWI